MRHLIHRPLAALTMGTVVAGSALALTVSAPLAAAGPCSEMFGNFGSLRESQTGAGMGAGSLNTNSLTQGSAGSLGDSSSSGSAGSSGSSGSAGSSGSSSSESSGSLGQEDGSPTLSRSSSLVQQLETGSLGNGISGSLDPLTGSVYGFPQWITGEMGTIPVLSGPTKVLQLLTGPTSPMGSPETIGVTGTDLGFMWDNGAGEVLMAFGDTMGDCSVPGNQWRGNILFRTGDTALGDGLTVDSVLTDDNGLAKEMVPRTNQPGEVTIIPTAGIAVNGTQYLRFMSVSHWGAPGFWDTNYSGLAYSTDNGETWTVDGKSSRPITDFPAGDGAPAPDRKWTNAQMSSYFHGRGDGYVYEYFTPSGRQGAARLARVPEAEMLDPDAYTYWDGSSWSTSVSAAEPVLPAQVSELSVQWHPGLNKYVSMYSSGMKAVMIRTADSPQGPWSRGTTLIDYSILPGVYGGYIHPWSSGNDLYYVVTTWNAYNVFLVHTDLSKLNLPGVAAPTAGNPTARAMVQPLEATSMPQDPADPADPDTQTDPSELMPELQTVTDVTADGPINAIAPTDAWDTNAPAITLEETGVQVKRRIAAAEVTAHGGMVPQE